MFIVFMCKIVKYTKKISDKSFSSLFFNEEKKTLYKHTILIINLYYNIQFNAIFLPKTRTQIQILEVSCSTIKLVRVIYF